MTPLFVPGSIDVAPQVLAAQARPIISLDSEEFKGLSNRILERLKPVFGTSQYIYRFPGTGPFMQETVVRNFVKEKVLCCVNGGDSARWAEIAQSLGKQVDRLTVPFGDAILPEPLFEALSEKNYDAVMLVHVDSTTGVQNPLKELVEQIHEAASETLVLVDGSASVGGIPIEMDAWGLDVLFSVSEMCLALPVGLSFAAFSRRALERAAQVENRGWYSDFIRLEKARIMDTFSLGSSISLLFALDAELERIQLEGLDARFNRHAALAHYLHHWAEENKFAMLAEKAYRSSTISVVENSRGMDIAALNSFLLERGMKIANGVGGLKNRYFCIAHMGEHQLGDIGALLNAINEFLTL